MFLTCQKAILLICLICFFAPMAFAQYVVKLTIAAQPALHNTDTIFAAGNFNNWQPGKYGYHFIADGQHNVLALQNVFTGPLEIKCTRGSWPKVESDINGNDIGNRVLDIISDTTINLSVAAWKDDFTPAVKPHTISPNVKILDTAFGLPQLNTSRRIWIYMPQDYNTSNKRYPVMYLQDGQNLFDNYTANFGEWGIDEYLDSISKKGKPSCIIVGIDNGAERMQEYNPYEYKEFGTGKGSLYTDFLAKTLKPFVDKHYRTLSSKDNTIIAGSSMGGLISFYAMLKYPEVFGKAGVFSPAFWTAEKIKGLTDSTGKRLTGKLFFYMGSMEGDSNVNKMDDVITALANKSTALIYTVVDTEGTHNETAWRKWFGPFYNWIMADGFNNVIKMEE